ncbi:MAG TPA: hypothetical protein VH520_03225 [Streptosporangiaceae bacterium]
MQQRMMVAPVVTNGRSALRVVVADDSAFREGMRAVLTQAGFEVAGLAADATSLVRCRWPSPAGSQVTRLPLEGAA